VIPEGAGAERDPVDVLLVGLGPVGATVANLLGRYGVRTLVIDKADGIFMAPRAIALDNDALRILQMAGLEDDAFAKVRIPRVRMRSPLFGDYAVADTSSEVDDLPMLVTFYQPELERVLRKRLGKYPSVEVRMGAELVGLEQDADGVTARIKGINGSETVRAAYLVGADGASSSVRTLTGIPFEGRSYAEDWLIVDAKKCANPIDDVEFWCDPGRPGPRMIAPGGRQRWEFMMKPGETASEMERDSVVRELLRRSINDAEFEIERVAVYRFHARTADRFSKGRCYLIGDAAHITPPFAGQGLVSGLRDAANLCWKLAWVLRGEASPAILDSYHVERRPHAIACINFALFLGGLVMPRSRVKAALVHGAMLLTGKIPGLRDRFRKLEMKPKNLFREGLFLPNHRASRLQPGTHLQQVRLRPVGERNTLRSDEILGDRMVLIGFGCDPAKSIEPALAERWIACGGGFVELHELGSPVAAATSFQDVTGTLVPGVASKDWVVVVRPDRAIVTDGPAASAGRLVRSTLEMMGTPNTRKPMPAPPSRRVNSADGNGAERRLVMRSP
jgi:3-(3-hydroxy-phenyl)propionate hydroxylase